MDHLLGLKENVIIGKLIPAGAGLNAYRQFAEQLVPEAETAEAAEAVETAEIVETAEPVVFEEE